jgi:hypothetical protein
MYSRISGLQVIQRYRYSAHFPVHSCTRTMVLSPPLVASWQRILWQPHRHFNLYIKSSWYRLIHFLLFLLNHFRLPSPELDTILDYPSTLLKRLSLSLYNPSARTPRKTPSSIVKEACSLIRYLAKDVLLLSRDLALRECVYRTVAYQLVYTSQYVLQSRKIYGRHSTYNVFTKQLQTSGKLK